MLPCRGAGPTFPRATAVRDRFPILMNTNPALPTASGVDMGKGISPQPIQLYGGWEVGLHLTTLGLSHPYLHQEVWLYSGGQKRYRAHFPECCSLWGTGTALILLLFEGQLFICLRHWYVRKGGAPLQAPMLPIQQIRDGAKSPMLMVSAMGHMCSYQ